MTSKSIVIMAENGLHARPAGELVKLAKGFPVKITISTAVKSANAASMLAVLALGLKKGVEITVSADGEGEAEAVNSITDFILSIKD